MLKFSRASVIAAFGLVFLALLFALPNFLSETQRQSLPGFMPKTTVNLGLDLQGGSHLLLQVDTDKVLDDRLTAFRKEVQSILRSRRAQGRERIRAKPVLLDKDERVVTVELRDATQYNEAIKRLRSLARGSGGGLGGGLGLGAQQDYEVSGNNDDTIKVAMTSNAQIRYSTEAVSDSIEVVRRRLDPGGNKEVSIQPQGTDRIVVQVPGDDDPEALKELINRTGQLSFHPVDLAIPGPVIDDWENISFNEDSGCREVGALPPGRMVRELVEDGIIGQTMVLERDPVISGTNVNSASASPNSDGAGFQINFVYDNIGARRFADYTRENIGQLFAIVLDCKIISAPRIQSAITGGSGRITGDFSVDEAVRVATLIRSGALPAPLQTIEQRTVNASLGQDSIDAGRIAIIIGFIAVIVYMFISYGRFGLYANLALIANIVLIAGALSLFGSTLTLPGIAGIVLTIGMAVDANVLIFERIREELRNGKPPIGATETGFQRARSAIIDANITTFLAAFIMFFLGAGPVRGFAVTLAIGVVTSVFTAYVLTRFFAGQYLLSKRPKTLKL